jgi:hypothetical protein
MTPELQTMGFEVVLPGHPEVHAWFMQHWSLLGAQRGIKAGHAVIPQWHRVKGMVVVVTDERGEKVGMVLFEELNPTEVIVHTALRTFGSRTDHAFKTAIQEARQQGYVRFYYAFSTQNRSAHRLMKSCALLADSVAVQPDWATSEWIFGNFV